MKNKSSLQLEQFQLSQMQIEKKFSGLLNWDYSKGNPYHYDTFGINKLKITASKPEIKAIVDRNSIELGKSIFEFEIFSLNIRRISELTIKQIELIFGITNNGFIDNFDKFINPNKEMIVHIDYPFTKTAIVEIPFMLVNDQVSPNTFTVGYLLWQISRAYDEIFKKYWKELGLFGHGFSDLNFLKIFILENNTFKMFIGS